MNLVSMYYIINLVLQLSFAYMQIGKLGFESLVLVRFLVLSTASSRLKAVTKLALA